MSKYKVVLVHAHSCYACQLQIGEYLDADEEYNKGYLEEPRIEFGHYCVDDDDWAMADLVGIDGTPGFFILDTEKSECVEINNIGLLSKTEIIEWIDSVLKGEER